MLDRLAFGFYRLLMVLAGIALVAAFGTILLNIASRLFGWNVPGLDGYAGYAIAAALFLALPGTFRAGEHIRATLVLEKLSPAARSRFELFGLLLGLAIAVYLAWFAARLVWVSYTLHDVAPTGDATPMWIPQLSMALGCIGFALSFLQALAARVRGTVFFLPKTDGESLHVD